MKNRVITISREFGSGGRTIGKKAAEKLGIPCFDAEIIRDMKFVVPDSITVFPAFSDTGPQKALPRRKPAGIPHTGSDPLRMLARRYFQHCLGSCP